MTAPPSKDPLQRIRRELERQAVRVRNGIKYVAGTDWTPPQPTPRDPLWRQGNATLWRYRGGTVRFSTPVLMMIGLVSRSSVFDLHEKASMVQALQKAGLDVYVLDWGVPDAGDADNTLETYLCRYLTRALRAMLRASQATEANLIGYCMGGAMALQALASMPDLPVRGLITMATPVDFDKLPAHFRALRDPEQEFESFIDSETGCIPPDLVNTYFRVRKPTADLVQYANLLENLWNDAYVGSHQAIARWTADHVPLPGALARQVVNDWLRPNGFVTGTLQLDGKAADMKAIRCPVLNIITLHDEVVVPAASRGLGNLIGSTDYELLELESGHIGLVIGKSAHKVSYPTIASWLQSHSERKEVSGACS